MNKQTDQNLSNQIQPAAIDPAGLTPDVSDSVTPTDKIVVMRKNPVPQTSGKKISRKLSKNLLLLQDKSSKKAHAISALKTQCELNGDISMLSVVGSRRGEGASFIAANLGVSFALSGRRTLLVDVNLANPSLHNLFGLSEHARGLTDALSASATPKMKLKIHQTIPNLNLLTAGTSIVGSEGLLLGMSAQRLFRALSSRFDTIIFDTPAALDSAVPDWFAKFSGTALLVARRNRTRMDDVEMVSERLSKHANVVGVAVNNISLFSRLR